MRKISILSPTRSRVQGAMQLATSCKKTADNPDRVEVLLYVDSDDPHLAQYQEAFKDEEFAKVTVGAPISVSKSWNILAEQCVGDVLIMGNDDVIYKTQGWDTILDGAIDEFPDEIYCIWFNDAINRDRHCAFPIVSRLWYETLGYFTPGIFEFGYNDTWIVDIARKVGDCCKYLHHVHSQHLHGTRHKRFRDATYRRNRQARNNKWGRDKKLFAETANTREAAAAKLRAVRELRQKDQAKG